ncbi:hypothetical protein NHQ30_009508 [Ciborinia camelliae]|nr:hypothetical protein NHQ30_009508 [Ciborinia camelliae]
MAHLIRLPPSHSGSSVTSPMSIQQQHLGPGPTAYFPPSNTSSPAQYGQRSPPSGGPTPPLTRSASAENTAAQLIEDFRKYAQKLRDQYESEIAHITADRQRAMEVIEGERAHIAADRKRAMEVIAEERELWDKERGLLVARIRDLEAKLASKGETVPPVGVFNLELANIGFNPAGVSNIKGHAKANLSPAGSGSTESKKSSHGHPEIKQESGRNADGSPFYAPAPKNPTRTFSTDSDTLRVEDIHAPGPTIIQVTQELTPSDFVGSSQHVSPEVSVPNHSGVHWEAESDIIGGSSIDISRIAPDLEGVPIRASAVDPVFVAQVLSPRSSSPGSSPSNKPPGRDVGLSLGKAHLEPESKRLTMYAGHTPNHSISRFADLVSGEDETPRGFDGTFDRNSLVPIPDENGVERCALDRLQPDDDEEEVHDRPLTGQLGLTNVPARDETFLEALGKRLEEVKNSRPASKDTSPSASVGSLSPVLEMKRPGGRGIGGGGEGKQCADEERDYEDQDEAMDVTLKLKPSLNFGRPMGFR